MITQKCIIVFEDGSRAIYVGDVQYDMVSRKRVKKVQFTVPIENEIEDDDVVKNLMNMFGMK